MIVDEFTITLSDEEGRVSVGLLKRSLENALEMLRSVEAAIVSSEFDVRWEVVHASMSSPLQMTLSPIVRSKKRNRRNRTIGSKIVSTMYKGIQGIEHRTKIPESFTGEAIEATLKLVKSASNEGAILSFASSNRPPVSMTADSIQHLDELVAKARLYVDLSTIEGRLEVISVHGRPSFTIWETFTNRKVECFVSEDHVTSLTKLLNRRVAVTGRISYRNHIPRAIQVEWPIRVLRSSDELPLPEDIGPIDITSGEHSEEHVRRMRNG